MRKAVWAAVISLAGRNKEAPGVQPLIGTGGATAEARRWGAAEKMRRPCTVERSRIVALYVGGEEAGEVRWLCVVGWLLSRRWIGAGEG